MHTLTFHTDPGHGWLEVPHTLVASLGIASKVSAYSYQGRGNVYLEEDCDASLAIEAMKARGEDFKIIEVNSPHADSFIRDLHSFRA